MKSVIFSVNFTCKLPLVDVHDNMTAARYRDEVLVPWLEPHMDGHALANRPIIQQHKAPPHTARLTTAFLQNAAVSVFPWSSMSPDMNILEHVWGHIASELIWWNICLQPPMTCDNASMPFGETFPRLTYRIWSEAADVRSKLLFASMEALLNTDYIGNTGCIRTLIFPHFPSIVYCFCSLLFSFSFSIW